MIVNIFVRAASLFGGIAVNKAISNAVSVVLPVSKAAFMNDPVAVIGTVIIQAVASDAVMSYVEARIVGALDNIAQDTLSTAIAQAEVANAAAEAAQTAADHIANPVKPAPKPAKN